MNYKFLCFIIVIFNLFCTTCIAEEIISIESPAINLSDAIYLIAKYLKINVILSPHIEGTASLNLQKVASSQAFEVLLKTHGLAKMQVGNIWFISSREEIIKQQQEDLQWHAINEESLPLYTYIWQPKFAHGEEMLALLKEGQHSFLSKRGAVYLDKRTNKIIISDVAKHLNSIKHLLFKLDVPIKQILIRVRLINIDQSVIDELGIDFTRLGKVSAEPNKGRYKLTLGQLANNSLLDIKLVALQNKGQAELISSPVLFTGDQQLASIETGEELPYQEISEGGGTAVAFKKAVLALKVKPKILPGNQILLQLQINQDRPNNRLVQGVPSISTQQIITHVLVKNGHTLALGGIYEINTAHEKQGLLLISDLPILGKLFAHHINDARKRKLLIFVTPSIV